MKILKRTAIRGPLIPTLRILPPCESVLRLHSERANYIAALWKRAKLTFLLPCHIVGSEKLITWVIDIFHEEIEKILWQLLQT